MSHFVNLLKHRCCNFIRTPKIFLFLLLSTRSYMTLGWALIQWVVSLQEVGNLDSEKSWENTTRQWRDERGRDWRHLKPRNTNDCQETSEDRKSQRRILSWSLQREHGPDLLTPWFQTLSLQTCKNTFLLSKVTQLEIICYSSPNFNIIYKNKNSIKLFNCSTSLFNKILWVKYKLFYKS